MKTTIAALFLGSLLVGTAYAGHKHCRNDLGTCKCNSNYSTTLFSTGRYRVDLSKGPVLINFNPKISGYYQIRIYLKTLAMSLTECGKKGYVNSIYKRDSCSNSFIAELCNKSTYRLFINRGRRSDTSVIVEISRYNSGCSQVKKVSSVYTKRNTYDKNRCLSIINFPSRNSCTKTKYRYKGNEYYQRYSGKRYHSKLKIRKKGSSKCGIGFSIRF